VQLNGEFTLHFCAAEACVPRWSYNLQQIWCWCQYVMYRIIVWHHKSLAYYCCLQLHSNRSNLFRSDISGIFAAISYVMRHVVLLQKSRNVFLFGKKV